jgi:hypothetical protein
MSSASSAKRAKRVAKVVTAPPAIWDTVPMRGFARLLQIVDKVSGDLVPFKASPNSR